jgi:hypothetical protein
MATRDEDVFKFPDELEDKKESKASAEDDFELEIEDDTPPEDRNRNALPKEMVEELEKDELENYSDGVKAKMIQMKKVWHDERREKERALREREAAETLAQRILAENKQLKTKLSNGEQSYLTTFKGAAELELDVARREYKEAYDMGDSDKLMDAQQKIADANYKLRRAQEYVPSRHDEENDVKSEIETQVPQPDQRTVAWQERNTWFGKDEEMTSLALGLHQKLVKEYGTSYPSTNEYWQKVDETMRRRFPDYFEIEQDKQEKTPSKPQRTERNSTVVAPASRSTASRKVVLKQSEVAIAKRLGLTPEQYVRAKLKMEAENG